MNQANTTPPSRLKLRLAARRRLADRFRQRWLEHRLRRRKARGRRGQAMPTTKLVAHLLGCQRSGTDMSIYLLDRCMDVDAFNENHRAAFNACRIKDRRVIERLVENSRAPCIVFKPICDSHRAAELLSWHEPTRLVWLYRDYRGVVNSSVVMWGDANLRHLKQLMAGDGDWGWSQWNREGYDPEALDEVRELVDDSLTPHGAAAIYWYLRNRCYFQQRLNERADVTVFCYRDLVSQPMECFARMCRFLSLAFSEDMAATVHARSLSKGRDIVLPPAIRELCEGMLARLDAEAQRRRANEPP